jgi:hypothetical protein
MVEVNMNEHNTKINALTETLIFEITKALALPPTRMNRKIVGLLVGKAARQFSELAGSGSGCRARRPGSRRALASS